MGNRQKLLLKRNMPGIVLILYFFLSTFSVAATIEVLEYNSNDKELGQNAFKV